MKKDFYVVSFANEDMLIEASSKDEARTIAAARTNRRIVFVRLANGIGWSV